MTLKEAQKMYPDAIQAKMHHLPHCISQAELEKIGRQIWGVTPDKEAKILFTKVGKCVSVVIASLQAAGHSNL